MNENINIKSYTITKNADGETYNVKIETNAMTICYENTDIKFLYGDIVAFPVSIKAHDSDGNIVYDWDLTRKPPENQEDNNEKPLEGQVEG